MEQNENKPEQDMYWAERDGETVAASCLKRSSSFFNNVNVNSYLDQLRKNWLFYHGQFNDGYEQAHQINFTGEQGELVSIGVNHFRNIAQHIINMVTASRPTFEAKAVNTDYKSLAQTYLANSILDYYMREKKLEQLIRKATEMAVVIGSSFIRLEWNATGGELYDFDPDTGEMNYEGEIEFDCLSPYDVVFDGTKSGWDNEWLIVRTFKNKHNLAAKYPDKKEDILAVPVNSNSSISKYNLSLFSNDVTDDIPVYELYHKKTEALPQGRYLMFIDGNIPLIDIPMPYRDIPIYRLSAAEFLGTPYSYSPMFDLYPLQEQLNALYSAIVTNQSAFAVQNLFVPRGADLDINSLEGALNILEGNAKPEPLNLTATPPEVFKSIEMIKAEMETLSGVSSVTRGNPEKSLQSGTALALVQSMSIQFISGLQQNYIMFQESIGTSLINIIKDFAKTPKTIALVGKNNRPYLKEFNSDDVKDINRVIVTVANPLARSTAGRVQMAEQMLQMGLIKNPSQYFEVINTGQLDTIMQSDMDELLLIRRENEYMMEGKEVIVDILDIHAVHIMEHRSLLSDPDLRMNVELRQLVQDHIQDHIDMLRTVDPDLLMMTGQQPLQNPMQGQMPPEMQQQVQGQDMAASDLMQQTQLESMNPEQFVSGQGVAGGQMIPQPAKPPAPFQSLPTNPADVSF